MVPVGDDSVRRAFLLLRDPLASMPRAVGTVALLAMVTWIAGDFLGGDHFAGFLGAMIALVVLVLFTRRRTLRTAEGERGALEALLREDLKRREGGRLLQLLMTGVTVLAVLAGLAVKVGRFGRTGGLTLEDLPVPITLLNLALLIAWDSFVTLPRARRLAGPDA